MKNTRGTLYIVGVGPGDPELITIKAIRTLKKCHTWLAPTATVNGPSTALGIISGAMDINGKEIINHHFPMKKIHRAETTDPEIQSSWDLAVYRINEKLEIGESVALPTLGDPSIYSTGLYVSETLLKLNPDTAITIIPGISSICATAAATGQSLCLGDERLIVIPAVFADDTIRKTLKNFDVVVFMKVHKSMHRLVPILEEMKLLDQSVLVERSSMDNERVRCDIKTAMHEKLHYFSTMIVRRTRP